MILFPAIDLKDGQAVRLLRGEMASATVFNDDPAAQARAFADAGFRWLHLVDLDGAFAGRPANAAAVEAILAPEHRTSVVEGESVSVRVDHSVSRILTTPQTIINKNIARRKT